MGVGHVLLSPLGLGYEATSLARYVQESNAILSNASYVIFVASCAVKDGCSQEKVEGCTSEWSRCYTDYKLTKKQLKQYGGQIVRFIENAPPQVDTSNQQGPCVIEKEDPLKQVEEV
uniref:Uncharacterized protein n=1 Tax=Tanacetum cinerariifolium TaxID=118510 RepID=A0A6L2KHL9_TANCI|nr:hypothetical protein [Tanacetum cinerariifolium]